ncbi:hypothetical protein [Flavobacterium sp. ZS1P14]|uniref:hypothetical protein n=1 Tax=Flavobacterium sp. ZS1P14 TaxID=3401729 RepID=UPI003AAF879E
MKQLAIMLFFLLSFHSRAQELFVVTEPASNVPSGSIGINLGQTWMKRQLESGYDYHILPEITWGITKNWMVRSTIFISNRTDNLRYEGGSIYAKYRFFSNDAVHNHFRMAAFGRYSINNSDIHQEVIETMGHNSGYETGIVVTKLIKKTAISSSLSFERALDNRPNYRFPSSQSDNAMNYSLSIGKLIYPRQYTHFKQTNINIMLEFLGQRLNENSKSYLDMVPSIQFIINSQAKINFAYTKEIYSSMLRTAPNGIYLKFEYTFFNPIKN